MPCDHLYLEIDILPADRIEHAINPIGDGEQRSGQPQHRRQMTRALPLTSEQEIE